MGSGRFLAFVQSFNHRISAPEVGQQLDIQGSEPSISGRRCTDHQCGNNVPLIRQFEADLAVRLQQLQLAGGSSGSAHLNWLLDACASTLSTHSSLASILSTSSPHPQQRLSTQRADEVLSLLDLCTSLQHMADHADHQLSLLQQALYRAVHALQTPVRAGRAATLQSAARRLRASLDGLSFLNDKHFKPLTEAHAALKHIVRQVAPTSDPAAPPLSHALDGTLLISLVLLAATLSSFAAPTTNRSSATRSTCKLLARYVSACSRSTGTVNAPWVPPLGQLQRDLKQEEMSCVFLELQRLQASASSLHDALIVASSDCMSMNVGELRHRADSLRKSSQEAQACISALLSHLASLFQAFLALRLALLPC